MDKEKLHIEAKKYLENWCEDTDDRNFSNILVGFTKHILEIKRDEEGRPVRRVNRSGIESMVGKIVAIDHYYGTPNERGFFPRKKSVGRLEVEDGWLYLYDKGKHGKDFHLALEIKPVDGEGKRIVSIEEVGVSYKETFEQLPKLKQRVEELADCLKYAITGLEWWNSEYPEGSDPTDIDNLEKFKKALTNKQEQ